MRRARRGRPYLAERVADLDDVRNRAVAHLLGVPMPGVPEPGHPSSPRCWSWCSWRATLGTACAGAVGACGEVASDPGLAHALDACRDLARTALAAPDARSARTMVQDAVSI